MVFLPRKLDKGPPKRKPEPHHRRNSQTKRNVIPGNTRRCGFGNSIIKANKPKMVQPRNDADSNSSSNKIDVRLSCPDLMAYYAEQSECRQQKNADLKLSLRFYFVTP